ncbi:MAG: ARPP-1 family domain-containing protein [Planctomycetota bacterium]
MRIRLQVPLAFLGAIAVITAVSCPNVRFGKKSRRSKPKGVEEAVKVVAEEEVVSRAERPSFETELTGPGDSGKADAGEFRVTGPFTFQNLSLYLVHGPDRFDGKDILTLKEAMEQKKVVVHETGNVQKLAIENVSDREVFIQSGDIVKGGKQDRILQVDVILPARSGVVPVASFCVEAGRWRPRGRESVRRFGSSGGRFSKKCLKLATRRSQKQGEVWDKVRETQKDIASNTGYRPERTQSPSSMQLAMEDKSLGEWVKTYRKKFGDVVKGKKDVIGYAFALNDKINCADVYGSHALFLKLWDKLFKSTAIEAVSELHLWRRKSVPPDAKAIAAFLRDAKKGAKSDRKVTERVDLRTWETKDAILYESCDAKREGKWVYRNYLTKHEGDRVQNSRDDNEEPERPRQR